MVECLQEQIWVRKLISRAAACRSDGCSDITQSRTENGQMSLPMYRCTAPTVCYVVYAENEHVRIQIRLGAAHAELNGNHLRT